MAYGSNKNKPIEDCAGGTGKWLAEQLQKNEATISRWCSNTSQPSLEMLVKIATVLNVEPKDLINNLKGA